jgi:signal recognition particle subunit SEC65
VPDHFYVYPAYLDRETPRSLGRRVDESAAVADVTVEMIVAAAKSLGLRAEAEPGKQYPRDVQRFGGRVKVTKKAGMSKARALKAIASAIRQAPPAKQEA